MSDHVAELTTGLSGLDQTLKGILAGDNIVWQVDAVEDYCRSRTVTKSPGCSARSTRLANPLWTA